MIAFINSLVTLTTLFSNCSKRNGRQSKLTVESYIVGVFQIEDFNFWLVRKEYGKELVFNTRFYAENVLKI